MAWILGVAGCVGLLPFVAAGQQQQQSGAVSDDQFVAKAATSGSAEVELGKMALRNAGSAQVKSFGQHMIDDHTQANQELLAIAGRKQIAVPRTVEPKQQECINKLTRLQGADFDKEYAKAMVKDHEEAVNLFQGESQQGRDADLKAFAAKTLPKLKDHLRMARELNGGASK